MPNTESADEGYARPADSSFGTSATPVNGDAPSQPAGPSSKPPITIESLYRMYNEGERTQPHWWASPDEWEKREAAQTLFGLATSSGSDEEEESPSPPSKGNKRLSGDGGEGQPSKRKKSLEGSAKPVVKKQSPWHPRAKLVFLACVLHIPPQDRGTIMFLGKPCGRNELFARILGICCKKPWGRKQVSSHSQTLKQKNLAPPEIQDILTTTDEQRGKIKNTGGAQGPILNFPFHPELRRLMGFGPDENLNYAPGEDKDWLYQYIKNPNAKGESERKAKRAYVRRNSNESRGPPSYNEPSSSHRPVAGRPVANTSSPEDLRYMRAAIADQEREVAAYATANGHHVPQRGGGEMYQYGPAPPPPARRDHQARPRTSEGLVTSRSTSFTPSPFSRAHSELKRSPPGPPDLAVIGLHFSPPERPAYLSRMKASLSAESLGHSRDISEVSEMMDAHTPRFWARGLPHDQPAVRGPMLPPIPSSGRRAGGMSDLDKYHHVG